METFYDATPGLVDRAAIALGFFDGVHPGHRVVIGKAVEEAKRLGVKAGVVTFKDHPRTLTRGSSPLLLTVIEQKLELFAELGVDFTLVLAFTEDLCRLSPREYVESVLVESLGARSISVGYNHHFGKDREGNPAILAIMGKEMGFDVHIAPMVYVGGKEVSSSSIRELISESKVAEAATLLARHYRLRGTVVKGEGRGRKLGFPTANMKLNEFQLVPGRGVYAGLTRFEDGRKLPCVINVGLRPTFTGAETMAAAAHTNVELLVEVHVLSFNEDLYDSILQVDFIDFLRAEQKFSSVDALREQIAADCRAAESVIAAALEQKASQHV